MHVEVPKLVCLRQNRKLKSRIQIRAFHQVNSYSLRIGSLSGKFLYIFFIRPSDVLQTISPLLYHPIGLFATGSELRMVPQLRLSSENGHFNIFSTKYPSDLTPKMYKNVQKTYSESRKKSWKSSENVFS